MKTIEKPIISERFDLNDIRKIREYNSLRHIEMTPDEIIADIHEGAAAMLAALNKKRQNYLNRRYESEDKSYTMFTIAEGETEYRY